MTSQLKHVLEHELRAQTLAATHGKSRLKTVKDEEAAKLIDEEEIKNRAVEAAEQTGIVFMTRLTKSPTSTTAAAPASLAKGFSVTYCR